MTVGLKTSNLGLGSPGIDLDAVVGGESALGERAGDDGPEPLDREHAIDRQPRELVGAARRHRPGE